MASASAPDLILRGGTIVDGTGAPPFVGDVAVTGDKITAVGSKLDVRGKEEFDASGLHILPGWIDPHTHFDAQWSWDPYLSPSSAAGVTTCVMGNCGIGYAPCQKDRRDFLNGLVEAVEDIPGEVIAKGMICDFETFEEYLDSIERKELACDVAVMIGHSAVRTWVMGQRASLSDRPQGAVKNPVLPREITAMANLVKDAVAAGALGFSTSRLLVHRDPKGVLTPGALAGTDEVSAITEAIAEAGGGVFEMSTDWSSYDDVAYSKLNPKEVAKYQNAEAGWMVDIARKHGSKIGFTFNCFPQVLNVFETMNQVPLGAIVVDAINAAGGMAKGQTFARVQGFLWSLAARMHPFIVSKTFNSLKQTHYKESNAEEFFALLREPSTRKKVVDETEARFNAINAKPHTRARLMLFQPFSSVYKWSPSYEPPAEESLAAIASRSGRSPFEVCYDHMADGGVWWRPQFGLYEKDLAPYHKLLSQPNVIPGFADGGAHGTMIQDATAATTSITQWVRDRTAGPRFPIETMVKKQTKDVADLYGLRDRGVLAAGLKADLNVIDMSTLKVCEPHVAHDLPLGQQRWVQEVEGYELTLLSGRPTYRRGVPTGTLPGRLVRNPNRKAEVWQNVARRVSGSFQDGLPEDDATVLENSIDGMEKTGASGAARLLRIEQQSQSRL